jgi:hypothetical protein
LLFLLSDYFEENSRQLIISSLKIRTLKKNTKISLSHLNQTNNSLTSSNPVSVCISLVIVFHEKISMFSFKFRP